MIPNKSTILPKFLPTNPLISPISPIIIINITITISGQ